MSRRWWTDLQTLISLDVLDKSLFTIVTHCEQLVLGGLYQDLEDGDESSPGSSPVQDGQIQLERVGPELTDLCDLLLSCLLGLVDKQLCQLHQLLRGARVLRGEGCDVLEGPLNVLVGGESPAEGPAVGTAKPQQSIVSWQHRSVVIHNVGIVVVRQDVVEGDVLHHVRIV